MAPIPRFPGRFLKKRIEKMRNVFLATFLFLIVTIIFTPLMVRGGLSFITEETLEAVLLLVQVSIAWSIFRLYEEAVRRREKEIGQLEKEYQEREKELIETFAYLGKVNVQMSLIKEFLGKFKAPSSRNEVKEYIDEILRMALSISKREWITLRIIKADKRQTVSEYWAKSSPQVETKEIKIGNRDLLELAGAQKYCHRAGYCVVPATGGVKASNQKTFLVFEENTIDREIQEFLTAAVNQCDIIYTLFELKHVR
jgi:hypothetical protein